MGQEQPRLVCSEGWRGLRASLPVMLGFVPFGLVLGAQAVQKGFQWFEVPLMTGMNFGGGSEFVAVRLWASPPDLLLVVAMTFLVNCRHLLMGAALAPHIQHLSTRTVLPALFFMCDESWAMALADTRKRLSERVSQAFSLQYYLGISAGLYMTWIASTALGAAIAPFIGNVERYGFDMAFTAVFLVLLRGMWPGLNGTRPWMLSLAVAAGTYLVLPGAWYVATGTLSGVIGAFFWAKEP